MRTFRCAWFIAMFGLLASAVSAQQEAAVQSQQKLASLFATLAEKTCSKIDAGWQCSYRGKGLRQISVIATIVPDDGPLGDVLLVSSLFAAQADFPDTAEFFRTVLKFNVDFDAGKLVLTDDGRLTIVALCPMRLLDKAHLVLLLDQAAAGNNEAFDALGKYALK